MRVVPTGMRDIRHRRRIRRTGSLLHRQGIHVSPQGHPGPVLRPEVAGDTGTTGQDLRIETGLSQPRGHIFGGGMLLARQLRMFVDVPAPPDQRVGVLGEPLLGYR
ncbi:Uncharacterised protein [Mycobacteroides abscessus subsp. abscessus]|nr:Uncharacterised protein [Mycobacteroides abscessus subsp. abscessus]